MFCRLFFFGNIIQYVKSIPMKVITVYFRHVKKYFMIANTFKGKCSPLRQLRSQSKCFSSETTQTNYKTVSVDAICMRCFQNSLTKFLSKRPAAKLKIKLCREATLKYVLQLKIRYFCSTRNKTIFLRGRNIFIYDLRL